jgi:hypothetical protein
MSFNESANRDNGTNGVILKDASTESACKIFRYEIRAGGADLLPRVRSDVSNSVAAVFPEEALASFAENADVYSEWFQELLGD